MGKISTLLFVAIALMLCGCTNKGTDAPGSENKIKLVSESNLVISADKTSTDIEFTTTDTWSAKVVSENNWFSIDPVSGNEKGSHKITVSCAANTDAEQHTGIVTIKCGKESATVTITQSAGDGETPKNITDYSQSSLNQSAYADEVKCENTFTFTTTLPWTAKVSTVTSSGEPSEDPVWFKISQSSGDVGAASIEITFPKNYTGASRYGSIEIECGDETLTINLQQKDKTREGITPKDPKTGTLVDKITHVGYDEYVEYIYDLESRPVKCLAFFHDPSGQTSDYIQRNPIIFEYGSSNVKRKSFNGAEYALENTISLVGGTVTKVVVESDPVNGQYAREVRVYDNNRLISNTISYPPTRSVLTREVITYTWTDSNITSIEKKTYVNGELFSTSDTSIQYDQEEGNNTNFDIFQLLLDQTMYPLMMFTPFDYFGGIRNEFLPLSITTVIRSDAGVEDFVVEYSYDRNSDGNVTAVYSNVADNKTAIFRLEY